MSAPARTPEPPRPIDRDSSATTPEQTPPERRRALDLSLTQVCGASLAAVTAAFLGSRIGVAGTVLGAGVASVVSTVGAKVYTESLHRARTYVGTTRTASSRHPDPADLPADAITTDDVVTPQPVADRALPGSDTDDAEMTVRTRGPIRVDLKRVIVASLAVFVVAFVVITGIELATGDALDGQSGTTISQLRGSTPADQTPTPSSTPGETTTPSSTPTTSEPSPTSGSASGTPSSGDGATSGPGSATNTAPAPTDAPSGGATGPEGAPNP